MTTQDQLTSIIDQLVDNMMNGVTLKNIRISLENRNLPVILIDKLTRIVEIKFNELNFI